MTLNLMNHGQKLPTIQGLGNYFKQTLSLFLTAAPPWPLVPLASCRLLARALPPCGLASPILRPAISSHSGRSNPGDNQDVRIRA